MTFEEIFLGFLVALASGALIGIEREQSAAHEKRPRLGGIRTFPLLALAGALSSLLAHAMGVWPILGALLVVGAFLTVSSFEEWTRDATPGVTTEVAALITFLLGVIALLPDLPMGTGQRYLLIVASAAVVMALLSFKTSLHQAISHVSTDDMYATAKFVILALIVLPLLPNRTIGPLQVLNPYNIGVMVVLVAAISFVGYLATRFAGESKGFALTGILGGLVSSTAVTISLAGRAGTTPALSGLATVAILTASAAMFARILLIVGIVDPELLPVLLVPLGTMAAAGGLAAWALYARRTSSGEAGESVAHRNPFEIASALKFGALYALITLGAKAAIVLLGDRGLYAASLLAGTADVDALTLSAARFHQEGLAAATAATAVTLATMTNTAVKAGLAAWLGGRQLGLSVGGGMLMMLLVGSTTLLFIR